MTKVNYGGPVPNAAGAEGSKVNPSSPHPMSSITAPSALPPMYSVDIVPQRAPNKQGSRWLLAEILRDWLRDNGYKYVAGYGWQGRQQQQHQEEAAEEGEVDEEEEEDDDDAWARAEWGRDHAAKRGRKATTFEREQDLARDDRYERLMRGEVLSDSPSSRDSCSSAESCCSASLRPRPRPRSPAEDTTWVYMLLKVADLIDAEMNRLERNLRYRLDPVRVWSVMREGGAVEQAGPGPEPDWWAQDVMLMNLFAYNLPHALYILLVDFTQPPDAGQPPDTTFPLDYNVPIVDVLEWLARDEHTGAWDLVGATDRLVRMDLGRFRLVPSYFLSLNREEMTKYRTALNKRNSMFFSEESSDCDTPARQ